MRMRFLSLPALLCACAVVSACGGGEPTKAAAPPGSPDNPMVGKLTEETQSGRKNESTAKTAEEPGYQKLVERQTNKPQDNFTPCNLVSPAQASSILGGPIQAPLEAPQGPTCIYRLKASGKGMVTVSVQTLDLAHAKRQLHGSQKLAVSGRPAYCGAVGQPMLYAGLSDGRVLAIGAPCKVARQFATRAVAQLEH